MLISESKKILSQEATKNVSEIQTYPDQVKAEEVVTVVIVEE